MPERKLRETLDELHRQLAQPEQLDERAVARLEATVAEIQGALDARSEGQPAADRIAGDPTSGDPTLVGELEDAARHFEVSHPTLAELIRRVTDALAQSGI